jgi:hypothetical protein
VHQKKAQYCLKLRNLNNENILECNWCNESFYKKWNLKRHLQTCQKKINSELAQNNLNELEEKYENTINELKKQIEETKFENLKGRVEEQKKIIENLQEILKTSVAKSPISLNNQNNTNITKNSLKYSNVLAPMNLTAEYIQDKFDKNFNKSYFYDGPAGLAVFCYQNFIRNEDGKLLMVCTDPSRKNFIYIDENGETFKDFRAQKFTNMIVGPYNEKCRNIIKDIFDKYRQYNIDKKPDPLTGLCYDIETIDKTRDMGVLNLSISKDNTPFLTKFSILCSDTSIYKDAINEIAQIEKEVFGEGGLQIDCEDE